VETLVPTHDCGAVYILRCGDMEEDDDPPKRPMIIPGPDYVSSAYLPGPPLLPVGQMGLAPDDERRRDMENDDMATTLAVVASQTLHHVESTRRGYTLVPCADDPTVVGVIPYVGLIQGFLRPSERRSIITTARVSYKQHAEAATALHKQNKVYRSPPKACADSSVRTPRLPIGASTDRLETLVVPVCGVALGPGVQDADAERESARVRRAKRLERSKREKAQKKTTGGAKKKKPRAPTRKKQRTTAAGENRAPRIITGADLAANNI